MEFWSLFVVAFMPILQVLLISLLGAFLADEHIKVLSTEARRYMTKIVFVVFAPALVFSNLAKTVTLQDIISWWFMPVNIGITFLIGGVLGWIAVKIMRPEPHLDGLIIANCSAGNLGNLMLIIIPVMCNQSGSPFGDTEVCNSHGLSYASFSMAFGFIYIWTVAYSQMKRSADLYSKIYRSTNSSAKLSDSSEVSFEANVMTNQSREGYNDQEDPLFPLPGQTDDSAEKQNIMPLLSSREVKGELLLWDKFKENFHKVAEELASPPSIAAIVGLIVGSVPWLKSLLIGVAAPLKIVQDCMTSLGDGAVPCIILIMGGNLTQGLRSSRIKSSAIIAVGVVRYVMLPLAGIGIISAAAEFGFLPESPLFRFVLLLQYALPPAMNIGIMAQLFNVGQDECSVIFLWTYLAAALALTIWSMVFLGFLT